MKNEVFDACLKEYEKSDGHTSFWPRLFEQFKKEGYKSSEDLRDKFKRERKKRKIPARDNNIVSKEVLISSPKILIFDIENSYIKAAIWNLNKQFVGRNQILEDWYMLAYSAKWLYEEEVYNGILTPKEAKNRDDKRIVTELYNLIDIADIVITYNGNNYDVPKINTRLLVHKIPPPNSYKSIDVYQTISKNFAFSSKAMDFVNQTLDLERKKENDGLELWTNAMNGDPDALNTMAEYNIQDSLVLQETYLAVRPWIRNHPNIGLWHDSTKPMCGYCGSEDLEYSDHSHSTPAGLYREFRCNHCHGVGRTQEQLLSKEKRKSLTKTI